MPVQLTGADHPPFKNQVPDPSGAEFDADADQFQLSAPIVTHILLFRWANRA